MARPDWQAERARNYDPQRGHFKVAKGLGTWKGRKPKAQPA